jgi:hypothetical protein
VACTTHTWPLHSFPGSRSAETCFLVPGADQLRVSPFYFPWMRSMNGGNVSNRPIASPINAATLILVISTAFNRHRRFSKYQHTSQITIVTVVTPESAPVGL